MFRIAYPELREVVIPQNREENPVLVVLKKRETSDTPLQTFSVDLSKISASIKTKSTKLVHIVGDTRIRINHRDIEAVGTKYISIFHSATVILGEGMFNALFAYAEKNNAIVAKKNG